MHFDYLNVLVFASVGLVFVFANLLIASFLRPKRLTDEGLETYECGEETIGAAWVQFDIRYYTVALVYVIFAVEIAFLFPWALVLREAFADTGVAQGTGIGMFALIEGLVFVAILFLGLVYVWAKGDLDWVLTYSGARYQPKFASTKLDRVAKVKDIEAELEAQHQAAKSKAQVQPEPSA
ncbi:MAG: NADH-quinone oxidoreductase subunit A [Planctomycetes bacterium]|nr:NADH-quinone oxidoreductase subunit A [Planctomycetota bacterium]